MLILIVKQKNYRIYYLTLSRCDWVPTVNKIIVEDDFRVFEMEGNGKVKEKILINDSKRMTFQYSAIQKRSCHLNHHLQQ